MSESAQPTTAHRGESARSATDGAIVCIVAKAPRPGAVKTRLAAALGDAPAVTLARAFLLDTLAMVRALPWARCVLAIDEPSQFSSHEHADEIWLQGDGDLGARLARLVRRGLASAPFVLVIGGDSPGLPVERMERARSALRDHDATVGPALDGGFYLLGLRRGPDRLFADVRWSTEHAFADMRAALEREHVTAHILEPWFDIDHAADLERLRGLLRDHAITAPATREALTRLGESRA